ncbi:MAG: tripartite tricarboxylate transporter TctB family protein [Gemmatimonadetes bacterium]|nr:tripartite tricarboxylate transporter TctB family protein [Gemmatimonadota bacterium]
MMRFTLAARTGEIAVCAVLLALALYAGIVSAGMPLGTYNLPGPAIFPLALSAILGVGAVARIAWLVARPDEAPGSVAVGHPNIVVAVLALGAVAFALERAGFFLTMVGFLALLYRVLGRGAWWRVALAAALSVAGFWFFFERVIGVVLPRGEFPWL